MPAPLTPKSPKHSPFFKPKDNRFVAGSLPRPYTYKEKSNVNKTYVNPFFLCVKNITLVSRSKRSSSVDSSSCSTRSRSRATSSSSMCSGSSWVLCQIKISKKKICRSLKSLPCFFKMKYLKTADDTFREHLIMQQHSETKENYGLR